MSCHESLIQLLCVLSCGTVARIYATEVATFEWCGKSNLDKPPVYVLAMLPLPNPQFPPANDRGNSFIPAIKLAVDHIDQHPDILSDFNLCMIVGDSGCNIITRTGVAYIDNVFYNSNRTIIGIVGPFCSEASRHLAELTMPNRTRIVQLMLGNTPLLDNHSRYQYTFGMITSSVVHVNTLIYMIRQNKWQQVAVLYDSTRSYFTHTYMELVNNLRRQNLDVIKYTGPVETFHIPLDEIQSMGIRVVIVLLSPTPARKLACMAGNDEFTYPARQFIFADRSVGNFLQENETDFSFSVLRNGREVQYQCDEQTIMRGIDGSLLLMYALDSVESNTTTISEYTVNEVKDEYRQYLEEHAMNINDSTLNESIYANRYYDATWTLAVNLNNILPRIGNDPSRLHINRSDDPAPEIFRDSLYNTTFQGMSVYVKFNKTNGHVPDNVDIFQVNGMEMELKGVWISDNNTINYEDDDDAGVFIDDEFEARVMTIHPVLAVFALLITTATFTLTISLHLVNIIYRNIHVIKASSPRLNHFIFTGCYFQIFAALIDTIYVLAMYSNTTWGYVVCNATTILTLLGYSLIFSTICVKSWRLYRIFIHSFSTQRLNSDVFLAGIVLILTIANVVLYIPALVAGPAGEERTEQITETDDGMLIQNVKLSCQPATLQYLLIPVIYQLILTLVAVMLAILNRKVKRKDFQNTKRTNALALSIAITWGILGPVILIVHEVGVDMNVEYSLYMVLLNCTVLLCQLILFLPLLWTSFKHKLPETNFSTLSTGFRRMSMVF